MTATDFLLLLPFDLLLELVLECLFEEQVIKSMCDYKKRQKRKLPNSQSRMKIKHGVDF